MKRLVMVVAALVFSATMCLTNAQGVSKGPFSVEFTKLSSYLGLAPYQMEEVSGINEFFAETQQKSLSKDHKRQEAGMWNAIYGNLKLMKSALTEGQYRKYVTLLNVTNNNNRLLGGIVLTDVYLADNE